MLRVSSPGEKFESRKVMDLLIEANSLDMLLVQAQHHAADCEYFKAFNLLKKIKDTDPFFLDAVPLLCSVMIELGK